MVKISKKVKETLTEKEIEQGKAVIMGVLSMILFFPMLVMMFSPAYSESKLYVRLYFVINTFFIIRGLVSLFLLIISKDSPKLSYTLKVCIKNFFK